MITAKVKCNSKSEGDPCTVTFGPDYQDGRNAEWAAATPSLSLSMTLRGAVADRFTVGGKYTLSFEPTDD